MAESSDYTSLVTIDLLESRLSRIEYAITADVGQVAPGADIKSSDQTVAARLSKLEHALSRLSAKSEVVRDILRLHARYPDWFHPVSPDQVPSDLSPFEMLSIVLASATLFPTTSSRLSSVFDLPIPPTEGMTGLIQLQPRIDCLLVRQRKQDWEFLRLRQETAEMLERWYKTAILGVGECLAEWNSRLYLAERTVRRMEVARERQEKEG